MRNEDTGLLLNDKNIKLHRTWFKQMTELLGINVLYRAPKEGFNKYNMYGEMGSRLEEINENYQPAEIVNAIYDEHPTQKTMRKLGWNAEMGDTTTVIHVPYDLHDIQAGALFVIPSGIDNAKGRVFRVLRISNIAIYPASISCELGPVLINKVDKDDIENFTPEKTETSFNLLNGEEEYE